MINFLTAIALSAEAALPSVMLEGHTYENWTNTASYASEVQQMNHLTNFVRRPFTFTGEVVAHSGNEFFILKDFESYAETQKQIEEAYKDTKRWNKMAIMNVACAGKFSSDRTIQEYVDDIWHLDKVVVKK